MKGGRARLSRSDPHATPMNPEQNQPRPTFALIGAAGFIAPRHMKAMREVGGALVAALDPNDSVGVIDSWFPDAHFFTEFERFDRHVDKLRRRGDGVGHVAICSPNYLHDAHIRFALRNGASAICEKPLVLNPWNIDALEEIESEHAGRIHTVLQLRLHPAILAVRERHAESSGVTDVEVTYITSRGRWYDQSWKGDVSKSGGVATNIGIHFFDMLSWIFGKAAANTVHLNDPHCAAGVLELERARVRWFLSIDASHLPAEQREKGQRTFRSIRIGGEEIEFSEGFGDLHTATYRDILAGGGYGLRDARPSIEMVHAIRTAPIAALSGDYHPYCRKVRG